MSLRATAGSVAISYIAKSEKRKTIAQNLKLRERSQKAEDKKASSIEYIVYSGEEREKKNTEFRS